MICPLCAGKGFVSLRGRETRTVHYGPPPRLREHVIAFRVPCDCEAGDRWLAEHTRAPSKK
jgi:hypothetical protein